MKIRRILYEDFMKLLLAAESVTYSTHTQDMLRFVRIILYLFTQMTNMSIHGSVKDINTISPDAI